MTKLVLALNAGSSSLKISLYALAGTHGDSDSPVVLKITSSITAISAPPAKFSFKATDSSKHDIIEQVEAITDHASAFAHFLRCLGRVEGIDKAQISYVCHRVVHGGEYSDPVIVSEEAYHHIENLSDLAPLYVAQLSAL
jgi:acetate kinase